jgi:hypothetical protein
VGVQLLFHNVFSHTRLVGWSSSKYSGYTTSKKEYFTSVEILASSLKVLVDIFHIS